MSLFRSKALDESRPNAYGDVIVLRRLGVPAVATIALLVFGVVGMASVTVVVPSRTTIRGELHASQRPYGIYSPQGGRIVDVHVHPDEEIVASRRILTIVPADADEPITLWAAHRGRVMSIAEEKGRLVSAGEVLATILPSDVDAEFRVDAPTAALLDVGQELSLRIAQFPDRGAGITGRVKAISRTQDPAGSQAGTHSPEPTSTVRVALPSPYISSDGVPIHLQPGLHCESTVIGRRTLGQWILSSLVPRFYR